MKKIFYFTAISASFLLFASCSNKDMGDEETTPKKQTISPVIKGVIGDLADVKSTPLTKAGVIEDNNDFHLGEQFHWHNGDQIKVVFYNNGDLNTTPIELLYTANVPEGTKPNSCQFTTNDFIPAGNYSVYALYPASGWKYDGDQYKLSYPDSPWGADYKFIIPFYENSSEHLRDYMFMKADVGNINIADAEDNAISLKFKHLSSLARFRIAITADGANIVEAITQIILREQSNYRFFYTQAYLNRIDEMDITPIEPSTTENIHVMSMINQAFFYDGSVWTFDYFMPVLPTKVSTTGMELIIRLSLYVDSRSKLTYFGTDQDPLSFDNELRFMPNGFEAGKSYYFNLRNTFE